MRTEGNAPSLQDGYVPTTSKDDVVDLVSIESGTQITIVPEDDASGRPVTVHIKQRGWNVDEVLTIHGRRLGSDRDEFWHMNPATERWRSGKPRPQTPAR
jgi:hypothetical protein